MAEESEGFSMILLKANSELKTVFARMIKTMGVNVTWTGNFVVLNNFLILSGNVRSLIFNFDNRKVITNVIELPDRQEDMEPVGDNEILTNVLNMTLYAFGKWGMIRGLKVEQDYNQLNDLFCAILKDVKVTPGFRDDNFRFYRNNIQMTYEEVVQAAVEEGKRKAQEAEKEESQAPEEERLGLWHKIRWGMEQCSFSKSVLNAYEKHAARLGNNFYRTGFHCNRCGEKLFMVVYPEGKEFPVETEEGRVYLARSYTCDHCNAFYTPRPGRLLKEGDVYSLKFGSDRKAYEDYQELLGRDGQRTTNYHFNEYEWERGKTREPETLEEACADLENMTEEELLELEEKLETDFYPKKEGAPYRKRIRELLHRKRREDKEKGKGSPEPEPAAEGTDSTGKYNRVDNPSGKIARADNPSEKIERAGTADEKKARTGNTEEKEAQGSPGKSAGTQTQGNPSGGRLGDTGFSQQKASTEQSSEGGRQAGGSGMGISQREGSGKEKVREKYDARMKVLDRMSLRQLQELRKQVQAEPKLEPLEKEDYCGQISQAQSRKEEEALRQKAEDCQGKPYGVLARIMTEMEGSQAPEAVKAELLEQLREQKKIRGEAEAAQLLASMPENLNRKQYQAFREKLSQYEEVDISPYEKQLEERRKQTERLELDSMLRRLPKSDRKGLRNMLKQLKEEYSEEAAAPVCKEIEKRLWKLEEAAIDKLCPNIMGMTFDEAAEAYEKIEGGAFLPELKTNTLEMIDKRLTKLKMDECALLVEKLKEELKGKVKDTERLHFYEVRKVMRGDWEPEEAELAARALNTYAADRSRYEFPVLICDSSGKKNGKEGFLLTPDHIFYNSTFNSEKIPVRSVMEIEGNSGLLTRGIYVKRGKGVKTRLPGGVPAKDLEAFGKVLDQFVAYLQEKPESRSISYLAKEKHEIKCCYRCGFTYRGGNVCPKCGNQENH